jgi:hypothetical protein
VPTDIGPVDLAVFHFPGNNFSGEIVPAIRDLVDREIVRIIDMVFVLKDGEGNVVALELDELDREVFAAYAGLDVAGSDEDLLNESDVLDIAAALEPNSSAAVLVWENVWAAPLASAIRAADGELVTLERIPRDLVLAAEEFAAAADASS